MNLAAENARDLLAAAKALGIAGLHGPATSLLVLALEEAQKARLLIALATGKADSRLSQDVASDITSRDHTLRHHAAFLASVSQTTLAKVMKPSRPSTALERKNYDADMAALGWHMKANSLKQRGLYVDYTEDRWKSPREIVAAEFSEGLVIVERFVEIATLQATKMSSSDADD